MIYELPRDRLARAAPLFTAARFDAAFVDAVFEGRQEGRVFVDAPQAPTAALLCRTYEYYVAGLPRGSGAALLRRFIREAPPEAGVFERLYGYVPVGYGWRAWERGLLDDHGARLRPIARRSFALPPAITLIDWRARVPAGAAIRPIDRALAEQIDAEFRHGIAAFWGDYDRFLGGGFGACLTVDGALASVANAITVSAREANIAVATAAPFRRRGLATLVCAAFVDACRARGLTPTWDCDAANEASAATARALGFVEGERFSQLSPPPGETIVGEAGRWARTLGAPPSNVVEWRRRDVASG